MRKVHHALQSLSLAFPIIDSLFRLQKLDFRLCFYLDYYFCVKLKGDSDSETKEVGRIVEQILSQSIAEVSQVPGARELIDAARDDSLAWPWLADHSGRDMLVAPVLLSSRTDPTTIEDQFYADLAALDFGVAMVI
jgi:hypothetical protein